MAKEPLALSEVLTGPSNETDYEALYAAVMATERGRRFLAGFAARNRHADTQTIVDALARVEAAVRGEPPTQGAAAAQDELRDIAAALSRIETEIGTGAVPAADTAPAIERIQDIAFVLHERTVEATLCDGLDAAIREIADACVQSDAAMERTRRARDLVRALNTRVGELVAGAGRQHRATEIERMIDQVPSTLAPLFELEPGQVEGFAQAVAELVQSLPALAGSPATQSAAQAEPAEQQVSKARAASEAPANGIVAPDAPPWESARNDEGNVSRAAEEAKPNAPPSIEDLLPQIEFVTRPGTPGNGGSYLRDNDAQSADGDFVRPLLAVGRVPASRPSSQLPSLTGPEEDPGDLFDSSPVVALPPRQKAEAQVVPRVPESVAVVAQSITAVPPQRAVPRPVASDPLAAVRALSDEELIALFS